MNTQPTPMIEALEWTSVRDVHVYMYAVARPAVHVHGEVTSPMDVSGLAPEPDWRLEVVSAIAHSTD